MNATRWQLRYEDAGFGLDGTTVTERVAAQAAIGPLRILVAHEQALIRLGVKALLQLHHRGWVVCGEALSGWETVIKAEKLMPDITILDLSIPQLNGLEAAKRIREASPKAEILIMSVHFADELVPDIVEAGVHGYVLNTDSDRDIVTAIECLADHKPFFTARAMQRLLTLNKPRATRQLLSPRERDVLRLISRGITSDQTALTLGISTKTVDTHRSNMLRKLDFHSGVELVRYAIRNQIIEA
jgi:DNA-binding NarL/FixJ family response regulator